MQRDGRRGGRHSERRTGQRAHLDFLIGSPRVAPVARLAACADAALIGRGQMLGQQATAASHAGSGMRAATERGWREQRVACGAQRSLERRLLGQHLHEAGQLGCVLSLQQLELVVGLLQLLEVELLRLGQTGQ